LLAIFWFRESFFRFRHPLFWFRQSFFYFGARYNDSTIFATVTHLFLWIHQPLFRFCRAPQWLSHFCYSDSIIFWRSDSVFFYFVSHFWDFIMRATVTRSFLYFYQSFLRFRQLFLCFSRVVLQWLSHFYDFVSYFWYFVNHFLWFCHTALQRLNHFFILSVILKILLVIFIILSDITEISLSHL
jgi:hypothetical protein